MASNWATHFKISRKQVYINQSKSKRSRSNPTQNYYKKKREQSVENIPGDNESTPEKDQTIKKKKPISKQDVKIILRRW